MARKKPARPANKKAVKKATKKAAPKAAARKAVKKAKRVVKKPVKTAKKAAKKAPRKAAKAVVRKAKKPVKKAKPANRKAPAKKASPVKKTAPVKKAAPIKKAAPKKAAAPTPVVSKKPNLDRPRKTVADIHGIPSSLGMARLASAAHSGGEEMRDTLKKNNSTSPRLTGGDVDADWQTADSHGDESPGGDNPTPDQDVVDEIGRALGVEYADDEELQGGAEISERDTHRWELDPNSKDDFEDKD